MADKLMAVCVKCGKATIWEDKLSDKPLCVECWDTEAEVESERSYLKRIKRLEYDASHCVEIRVKNIVRCRRYRLGHLEELADYHRRWCQGRRGLIALRQRDYYWSHRDAQVDRVKRYREAQRVKGCAGLPAQGA